MNLVSVVHGQCEGTLASGECVPTIVSFQFRLPAIVQVHKSSPRVAFFKVTLGWCRQRQMNPALNSGVMVVVMVMVMVMMMMMIMMLDA